MTKQMTQEEAAEFAASLKWQDMTHRERAELQIVQDRLCMPFAVFHEAVEKTVGRPVSTYELGRNRDGLISDIFEAVTDEPADRDDG